MHLLTKKTKIKILKKLYSLKSSRLAEYITLAIVLFGFLIYVYRPSSPPTHITVISTKSSNSSTKNTAPKSSAPGSISYNNQPPVSLPATPVISPKPLIVIPKPGIKTSNTVKPVVKPAPTSPVSSLTPTSTSTPAPASTSPSPSPTPTSSTPPPTTTSYTSTNWSGYLATGGNYTAISGAWQATDPTGNGSTTSADATWIGIGGVTSSDLIQIGTTNSVSPSGKVTSSAFYEMLPNAAIDISSLNVSPGDQMTATISETASNSWSMTITDVTKNETFSDQFSYNSSNSSAEWIEEDPSYSNGQLVPFDNFNIANFTNAATTSNGQSLNLLTATAQPITMVTSSGQPEATPSNINASGTGFSVSQN